MSDLPRLSKLTPFNPEYRQDPDGMLRRLREQAPVSRDDRSRSFLLAAYDDVRNVLNDRSLWRGPEKAEPSAGGERLLKDTYDVDRKSGVRRTYSMIQMDDPDHSRVRTPFAQALYARVSKSRPDVESIVDEALNGLSGRDKFDLLADFAVPIPIDVIASLLGVDRGKRDEFRDWSEGVMQFLNPSRTPAQSAHRDRSQTAIVSYFGELIRGRRSHPQDDLISDMVRLQADGVPIIDEEIVANLVTLLTAGNLTTSDLIGNGVYLLLSHPSELAKFAKDHTLINPMVEEILRYSPPLDVTVRVASKDMQLRGCPIAQTQTMTTLLRAANRDPSQFENPDQFDITRKAKPHMSFGGGAHICLGAPLARMEAQVSLARLFARFRNLRLADPTAPPPKRSLPFVNGFESLEVLT